MGKNTQLLTGTINTNLIRDNFDDILRLTHSIVEGNATGELVLRKLGSYSRKNALANALKEMGKIEKTIFILEYASDPEFRRRVHVGLNKGEEMNGLARVVFFGRRGQFWEHDYQEQFQKASCLNIIINAIVHWNTKYLTKAWEHHKSEHPDADEKLLKHISPLNWKHINFLGEYSFNKNVEFEKDKLRKLNTA
jgi:TnpA family transposase